MQIQKSDIGKLLPFAGAGITAYGFGKIAHKHGHPKLMIGAYGIAGMAIGYGLTDIAMIKTGVKQDQGWDGLVDVIYVGSGIAVAAVTFIVSKIIKK